MGILDMFFGKGRETQTCSRQAHDFVRPYPLACRKCGLTLQWDCRQIETYMGSWFDGTAYQWTPVMDAERIVSFSVSCGNSPVFEAKCDFSTLTVRNCLNGSRDGWRQRDYPEDYFEPRRLPLSADAQKAIRAFLKKYDFTKWKTPVHYVENHDAPGFSVEKRFFCTFADGKRFCCLKPENEEFDRLICLLREMIQASARDEDQDFIHRMLEDTEKKAKQIYWLISQSLEPAHMELISQGAPYLNYVVSREMSMGDNANAELMVNVIRFSDGAAWVTMTPVPEPEYQWESLAAGIENDLGSAYDLLTQHFETLPEPGRKLFPIVAIVLDGPITDDWLAAQARFQSLPGVNKNVLTIALVMGDRVEKRLLKKFDGVIYHINSMEDIINEMDSPLFGY